METVSNLITMSVMEKLSIDVDTDPIKYSNDDEYDESGNSDYKVFKGKPLIKLANGSFAVYNTEIVIDRVFSSLYFDFNEIRRNLSGRQPDIANIFTSEFIEKTLFAGLVSSCINLNDYNAYNEEELLKVHKIKDKELGYPDFLIRNTSRNKLILFECKDIRLNAWIKESRNYDLLERELKNKIVKKKYKTDRQQKCHIKMMPKRIGVGQIAGHVANVSNGCFPWAKDLPKDAIVYPVLVIADNRLIFDGLPRLMQQWYYECLNEEGVTDTIKERPLIMMSPLTLIKYHDLFYSNGFEFFFDSYYRSINKQMIQDELDAINKSISFDTYMEQYPYYLEDLRKELMKTLYEY